MPSLRRSFSSPSVRSSPYPSTANTSAARARATALHPRRSSGSATAERRVLADIEWWRVCDGQCDLDQQDQFQEAGQVLPGGTLMLSAGGDPESPLSLHSFSMDSMQSNAFAALSIAPFSPQENTRHGRDSSVDSTPELSSAPLETIQLPLADPVSSPLGYNSLFPSSLTRMGPSFGLRSVSAPGLSHLGTPEPDFADMGGDSFSLHQNLFQ